MNRRAQMGPTPRLPVFLSVAVLVGVLIAKEATRVGIIPAVATGALGIALSLASIYAVTHAVAWAYREVTE